MQGLMAFHLYNIGWQTEYIHTYTLFNLEFKVAKVLSSISELQV